MIARLRGRFAGESGDGLVLDVGGVGYLVQATPRARRRAREVDEVTLETYLHVREDALQLYGFADADERELFEQLLSVSGIGPKVALAIVSGSTPAELRRAIALEDTARFEAIPGIGKKTAQRVVLELKEKVGAEAIPSAGRGTRGHARRARRARRARLLGRRRRAGPRRGRSRPPGRGARPAGAQGGMTEARAVPGAGAEAGRRGGSSARSARAGSTTSSGRSGSRSSCAIALDAATARGEALDHVLLAGPPGLGKTSLAHIIREELGVGLRTVAGPALERKGDIAAILTALEARDVLFVDEIHRLNRAVEEILYPALEDFRLDIVVGQGPAARTLTLDLPPFTLVGATTRTGLLTTPLRDRFGMTFRLGYYEPEELAHDRPPLGAHPRRRDRGRGRRRDRAALARDAAHREPHPPARARRRRGAPRRARSPPRSPTRRSSCSRSTSRGSSGSTASCCRRSSTSSRAGRSACRRSPSRSARSRTRSRTSTSRTCSSSASSSARRAGASSRSSGASTSGATAEVDAQPLLSPSSGSPRQRRAVARGLRRPHPQRSRLRGEQLARQAVMTVELATALYRRGRSGRSPATASSRRWPGRCERRAEA